MNTLTIGLTLLKLVPLVAEAVRNAEELDSTPGNGPEKLTLVKAIVKELYDKSSPTIPFEQIVGTLENIIKAIVTFYNNTKLFKKK